MRIMDTSVLCTVVLLLAAGAVMADDDDGDCKKLLDIILVVDGSESINGTNFEMLRQSLDDIVSNYGLVIGKTDTRIGLVLYSSNITSKINLTGNLEALKLNITDMLQPRDGTNTDLGIEIMRDMFLNDGRNDVAHLGVVITDGNSKYPDETARQAGLAHAQGINMYAVGVGNLIDTTELQAIASSNNQVLTVDNFNELGLVMESLVTLVCPDPCSDCRIQNGVGYARHPTDCYQYVQCFVQDGNVNGPYRAEYMVCPFGLYWDQDVLTCQRVKDVNCPQEKCTDKDDVVSYFYNNFDNKRAYWECIDGYISNATCCPKNQEYKPEGGCVNDTDLNNTKPCPPEEPTPLPSCNNETRKGNSDTEYYWNVPGWGWMPMKCPQGTMYNESSCNCDHGPIEHIPCTPELYLPFNGDIKDKSGKSVYVQNNNVQVDVEEGAAVFDGTNWLRIPRFSNAQFPDKLVITLSYKDAENEPGSSMEQQALVTNGDCGENATLKIAKDDNNVFFGARTSQGTTRIVTLPVTSPGWKNVAYIYNNGKLEGRVNQDSKNEIAGRIGSTQCALQIGNGTDLNSFKGSMDNITVYFCIPDFI